MNRIEKILGEVEKKRDEYPEDKHWVDTYEKQAEFFRWLLEEAEDVPTYEVHQPRVEPTVWGMGDVSYHIRIQLQKIKTSLDGPVVLIFDYQSSASTVNEVK